jgi:hypothetical protein
MNRRAFSFEETFVDDFTVKEEASQSYALPGRLRWVWPLKGSQT